MFLPIQLYTTQESLFIFSLHIPLYVSIRTGFKTKTTIKDRPFFPNIQWSTGENKECLHFYTISFRLRCRSNKTMKAIDKSSKRFIRGINAGWMQVFD